MKSVSWHNKVFKLPENENHRFDVVGMGLNAVDRILLVDEYPAQGGKEAVISQKLLPGGQVATAMVCCRKLGLSRVRYIGSVGDGELGKLSLSSIKESGVDTQYVSIRQNTQNQWAVIIVDKKTGERTIFWHRPDELRIDIESITEESICCAPVIHLDGHDEDAAIKAAALAKECGILTVLDIDTMRERTIELLPLIDFCICSETFPKKLTGVDIFGHALKGIADLCQGFIAATRGQRGVSFLWDGEIITIPTFKVNCIDTTGAGDVFHGAFIYGLCKGWPLGRILTFANAAAAINCTKWGARGGICTEKEVEEFIFSFP